MDIQIITRKISKPNEKTLWEATALSQDFEVNVTAASELESLRQLHANLRLMYRFSRVARTKLELTMGWHKCHTNIFKKIEEEHED
jgi:hypothetical protein